MFDPPHIVRAGPKSWLAASYGKLSEDWRDDISQGFTECFRVLKADGVLIFKWNETQILTSDILKLTPLSHCSVREMVKRYDALACFREAVVYGYVKRTLCYWLLERKENAKTDSGDSV